jgi:hypothetical protein
MAERVGEGIIGRELDGKKGEKDVSELGRHFTTACDQKLARLFALSFACGSLAIMLASHSTNTLTSTFRCSFSFFDSRIEFRSMFITTLFLFLFLCLGQYSYFPLNICLLSLSLSLFLFRLRRLTLPQGGLP